ncbi:type 4a pilus biogenesis lipoprotein PilP [Pseudomonas sp. LRF_L74]|uniref:type 4a pilus biogenesis lipoprotein PilP n=1 Tax=Pseudomonas sp. LRF_L74 TaxID=3369422 RepID=UPI003F5FA189
MKVARLLYLPAMVVYLAGCSGSSDFADLQEFMDQQRARPNGKVEAIPKSPVYEAFVYKAANMRSPFQPPIKIELNAQKKGSKDIKPDETRVKQFLEGFNIETFEMVGTLSNDGSTYGLVKGAGGVHRIKVGDYLGRNDGRISAITESEIDVIEIVPDGEGGWLERPRSLPLKERS